MFLSGEIKLNKDFAKKFCVDQTYVSHYYEHLQNMSALQKDRSNERHSQKTKHLQMHYGDYNWQDLVISGKLKSLVIQELDTYLERHSLKKVGNKSDTLKAITCHMFQILYTTIPDHGMDSDIESDEVNESDDDIVQADLRNSIDSESDEGDSESTQLETSTTNIPDHQSDLENASAEESEDDISLVDLRNLFSGSVTQHDMNSADSQEESAHHYDITRSGRKAGSWKSKYFL